MTRLVLLNGPPRCGKDTAAQGLAQFCKIHVVKNTAPMDAAIKAFFGFTDPEWTFAREKGKDIPMLRLNGLSLRQVLISFSEDWAKPKFGTGIFGTLGVKALEPDALNVCSDSGFESEALEYLKALGASNIMLFHIGRKGCSFDGDSRSYIQVPGVTPVPVSNNTSPEALAKTIYQHILHWNRKP